MKRILSLILFLCVALTAIVLYLPGAATGTETSYLPGDVDGSGKVDGADFTRLAQYTAEWAVTINLAAADLNRDGIINGADVTLLLQYLAEWDVTLPEPDSVPIIDSPVYDNQVSEYSASYGGVDALGRRIGIEGDAGTLKKEKYVGLFYFLWMGTNGTQLYDNTKILNNYSDALYNVNRWGDVGVFHFWGEPLFGYYVSNDKWVMRKHIQMLTDADVDFLIFDTTNASGGPTTQSITQAGGGNNTYVANALALLGILDEYAKEGWDVPQIVFYTNSNSGRVMDVLYDEIYQSHPEYSHLWFNWEGKPMIIGDSAQASSTARRFFRIKESQWPTEGKKEDGMPWMEFDRLLTQDAVYHSNGKTVMNVSVAQHNATCKMSASWYGSADRTRSCYTGSYVRNDETVMLGLNFQEQWDFALKQDPDMIFITGWNEWIAQRQPSQAGEPIVFVDTASMEGSRDTEPMKGGFGDNYYMQMIENIRKFKGTEPKIATDNTAKINVHGGFGQWNYIRAYYKDYENDTVNRNQRSYGGIVYQNTTGRNDIIEAKTCNDNNNIYFFVRTKDALTAPEGNNWMNLYIATGEDNRGTWCGYSYVLNRVTPADTAVLDRYNGNSWEKAADVEYSVSGDMMMVAIPKAALGISGSDFTIQFKWADHCEFGNVDSFYTDGDAAPIGRMNYVYCAGKS